MNKDHITELALAHGFKLKTQPDGTEALNPYVFDFVCAINSSHDALLSAKNAEIAKHRLHIATLEQMLGHALDGSDKDAEIAALKAEINDADFEFIRLCDAAGYNGGVGVSPEEFMAALRQRAVQVCGAGYVQGWYDHKNRLPHLAATEMHKIVALAVQPRPLTADEHSVMQAAIADGLEIVHGGQAVP